MRMFVLLEQRNPPVPSPLMVDMVDRLLRAGHEVELARCDELLLAADRLVPTHDLYLLKSHSTLALSTAAVLHNQGARWLNPYPACEATADKVRTARLLRAAGVPVPRTWAVSDPARLRALAGRGPLVVKPATGLHGADVHIVRRPSDLDQMPAGGSWVVQDHIDGPGEDLKIYVAGDRVFATRKPFSAQSYARPGVECAVPPEVRRLALRAGAAAGLGLFGLDVVESELGPVVVDLNYFPGYRGVAGAAEAVAGYVRDIAESRRGMPVPPPQREGDPVGLAGTPGRVWVRAARPIASAGGPA